MADSERVNRKEQWGGARKGNMGGGQGAELLSWHQMMTGSEMMTRKR